MSKPHRGQSIRELFARGRGECPVCNRKNIKVLYEMEAGGQKFKICKTCKAAIKNGTKKLPVVDAPAAPSEAKASGEEAKAAEPAKAETAAAEETTASQAATEVAASSAEA